MRLAVPLSRPIGRSASIAIVDASATNYLLCCRVSGGLLDCPDQKVESIMGKQGQGLRGGHAPAPFLESVLPPRTSSRSVSTRSTADSKSHLKRTHPMPKGLLNVGNTCYANAALQCLLSTALTHALIDPKASAIFRRYSSNPKLLEQGSGSVDSDEDDTEARLTERQRRRKDRDDRRLQENCRWLTEELKAIAIDYHSPAAAPTSLASWLSPRTAIVDPGSITRSPDRLSGCLRPYQQEDAHEFLRALLSTLVMNGQNKQLSTLFDGLLESAVTCLHCRRPSLTRDRYMDLSLDICSSSVSNLTEALEEFTKTETLSGDNKVYCQKCAMKRTATKGLRLATAPSVLVCHFKRFAFDRYGRMVRLAKHVGFPQRLEIGDYMSRVNKARPPPYELISVLVHQGQTCDSGHYLAYVKNNGDWYKCNDSLVEKVDEATVMKQQAYILVYEVEEMRSRHGYSAPSTRHHRDAEDATPFGNWREYLFSSSICGMDDSLLRDICWDAGYVDKTKKEAASTASKRRRSRRSQSGSMDSHHDAHDDLSTLGESTVDSADSKIPFRRISSSGNLKDVGYRNSVSHHSTGRARQHFFASSDTSCKEAIPDYRSSKPWTSTSAAETRHKPRNGELPPRLPPTSDRHRRTLSSGSAVGSQPSQGYY